MKINNEKGRQFLDDLYFARILLQEEIATRLKSDIPRRILFLTTAISFSTAFVAYSMPNLSLAEQATCAAVNASAGFFSLGLSTRIKQ